MRNAMMTNWMQEMDDLFRTFSPPMRPYANPAADQSKTWFSPAVDVRETEKEYWFHFDLPGLTEKELSVQLNGRELTVSGERQFEKASGEIRHHRTERFFGRFERSFVLPEKVNSEKIDAKFKDGVLEIHIPKNEEAQPKAIPVRNH